MTNEAPASSRPTDPLVPYEPSVPVDELDRALRPLRRVLAWVMGDADVRATEIRYLGVNGGHWFNPALKLDLPAPAREAVLEIASSLTRFRTYTRRFDGFATSSNCNRPAEIPSTSELQPIAKRRPNS